MKRKQKMTTLMLDARVTQMLDEIAQADPVQPGNRSHVVRSLIVRAHEKLFKNNSKKT